MLKTREMNLISMKQNEITGLIGAYGWEEIPSRNPYMYSYKNNDGDRMNFYYTTGTLTIQTPAGKMRMERGVLTMEALETICSTNTKTKS